VLRIINKLILSSSVYFNKYDDSFMKDEVWWAKPLEQEAVMLGKVRFVQ
jgi:hypothetical protein